MIKIYFSEYYMDYIFVIGKQPYYFSEGPKLDGTMWLVEVWPQHLKDKHAVTYICTVKD
jgi:hypothetical protein